MSAAGNCCPRTRGTAPRMSTGSPPVTPKANGKTPVAAATGELAVFLSFQDSSVVRRRISEDFRPKPFRGYTYANREATVVVGTIAQLGSEYVGEFTLSGARASYASSLRTGWKLLPQYGMLLDVELRHRGGGIFDFKGILSRDQV